MRIRININVRTRIRFNINIGTKIRININVGKSIMPEYKPKDEHTHKYMRKRLSNHIFVMQMVCTKF